MKIPAKLVKGDSLSWFDEPTVDNLGNPLSPSSWTLSYAIRGTVNLTLTASESGGRWLTSITTTQSDTLTAGTYFWQAYATSGSNRITLGQGQIVVEPNLSSASAGFDGRSQAQKDLDSVQAAMRAIISGGAVQEYTIAGRSLRKMTMTDLIMLENKLKADVVREKKAEMIRNGLGNPNNLFVRFK